MDQYFYCYSRALKHFLKMRGVPYYDKGTHRNGNKYYRFIRNDELKRQLSYWEEYKKQFPR